MAESEASLQRNLDILKSYCDSNHLKVNMSKTKVVVFSKSKLRLRNLKTFKFGDASLERVDLTGFNRIAIHFPCVGSWMAPGQGSLWLI